MRLQRQILTQTNNTHLVSPPQDTRLRVINEIHKHNLGSLPQDSRIWIVAMIQLGSPPQDLGGRLKKRSRRQWTLDRRRPPLAKQVHDLQSTLLGLQRTIAKLDDGFSKFKRDADSMSRNTTPRDFPRRGHESNFEKHGDGLHRFKISDGDRSQTRSPEFSTSVHAHNEHLDYGPRSMHTYSPQPHGTGEEGRLPSSGHSQNAQESSQLLSILKKLADCQVANTLRGSGEDDRNEQRREDMYDRRKISEEKSIALLTRHSLLKDRSEGKEIQVALKSKHVARAT